MAGMATSAVKAGGDTVTAANNNALRTDIIAMAGDYTTTTGSSNAYAAAVDSAFSLVDGISIRLALNFTNTDVATLNVTPSGGAATGAKTIVNEDGSALSPGDLQSGGVYTFIYKSASTKWYKQGRSLGRSVLVDDIIGTGSISSVPNTPYTFTIPANVLTANRKLRIHLDFVGGNSGGTYTINGSLKFNGTEMNQINSSISGLGSNASTTGFADFQVYALTSATQTCDASLVEKTQNNAVTTFITKVDPGSYGTHKSIDCTSAVTVTLVLTGTLSSSAAITITRFLAWIE